MARKKDNVAELVSRYEWIRKTTDEAISRRSSISEFQGLEQELREKQLAILDSYNRTKPITHPRDKGDQREEILRHFFSKHGLIPERFGVSTVSTRVVAPSGHISPELDILFYEKNETITLKRFENTLDYFPIESVHGMIQVKSRLTKKSLREGLENIKAFKTLSPTANLEKAVGGLTLRTGLYKRFGLLFAYEYDLMWEDVYKEIKEFSGENLSEVLPNIICILDKGHFLFGDSERKRYCWHQRDLEGLESPLLHGFPDHSGSCLLNFYFILSDLLRQSNAGAPNINDYLRMPLTAGPHSYSHSHGAITELATCTDHGSYLKILTASQIDTLTKGVETAEAINLIKAIDIASGKDGLDEASYERQPGVVKIYNPENLGFDEILLGNRGTLSFESLVINEETVWIPHYYCSKEALFTCPDCEKNDRRRLKRTAKLEPK